MTTQEGKAKKTNTNHKATGGISTYNDLMNDISLDKRSSVVTTARKPVSNRYERPQQEKDSLSYKRSTTDRSRFSGGTSLHRSSRHGDQANKEHYSSSGHQNVPTSSEVQDAKPHFPLPLDATFADFSMKGQVKKAIDALGYTTPTQIQIEVWNAAMNGSNIVGQSQTGTGKTTAFLLPILQQIDGRNRYPQALIVAPTRELVQQIREDIKKLTEFLPMRSMTLMGGRALRFQQEDLSYGPQFIVATPGRLIEFMQKKLFDVHKINYFVLDEVDRMLDMGFIEDVDWIWSQLDNIRQTMTFSATINAEIKDIIGRHCPDYTLLRVGEAITVDKIDHTYIDLNHEHKFATLINVLQSHKSQKTLIFSQTKRNTEVITRALQQEKIGGEKIHAEYLNGDLDMRQRTRALRSFKDGTCKILVVTDVAARGLNMDNVELVINFDVPREPESYIHRIGRTGRAGASGKAITFVDRDEKHLVLEIEKTQRIKLKKNNAIVPVVDKDMDYIDVNLDRPLPPSEKKRRMVARSLTRERTGERLQPRQRSYGQRYNSGEQRRDRYSSRGSFAKSRTERSSSWNDSSRPSSSNRSEPRGRFGTTERGTRNSSSLYSNRSYGRTDSSSSRSSSSRGASSTSIGGYSPDFLRQQRIEERERFTPRRPSSPSPRGGRPSPAGERGAGRKPRLSSKPYSNIIA